MLDREILIEHCTNKLNNYAMKLIKREVNQERIKSNMCEAAERESKPQSEHGKLEAMLEMMLEQDED